MLTSLIAAAWAHVIRAVWDFDSGEGHLASGEGKDRPAADLQGFHLKDVLHKSATIPQQPQHVKQHKNH